ncbi:LysE family translocator [Ahrensia sp. R2A130]|uniref:LysE family translocator n=1 Tax=Ahrensia sp. R2A130 TaxID=744979 RepID=UPI0001E09C88|nr:LysE family transporter [Ahrensia sp. R2A130]EFL88381.1 RhtB family transporter [Ahrensia sp. R2A130]
MIDLASLASIALAFLVVTVSPGPANIAVATVSMSAGRKAGHSFALGLSCGLAFWGLVAATGMGAVLQSTPPVLIAMKLLGGAYLIWLALQSARSAMRSEKHAISEAPQGRWFRQGLLLNLSNPKAVVAWMAALSMGLGDSGAAGMLPVATALCIAIGFANYTVHAAAFSLPGFMRGYQRMRRAVDGAVSVLFAAAGFGLLRSALTR